MVIPKTKYELITPSTDLLCRRCGKNLWTSCICFTGVWGYDKTAERNDPEYYQGQADALAFLNGDVAADDNEFAPLHSDLIADYALWCLGHNLVVACALKRAELKGKQEATQWNHDYKVRGWTY